MASLKIFFLAVIFIATSGAIFSDYFRNHKFISAFAAIVAIIGSYYLFHDLYSDLKSANEYKKEEGSQSSSSEIIKNDFTKVSKDGVWFSGTVISVSDYISPNDGAAGGTQIFVLTIKDKYGNDVKTEFYPYHVTHNGKTIIDIDMYQNMSNVDWGNFKTKAVYSSIRVGTSVKLKIVCGRDQLCYSDTLQIL